MERQEKGQGAGQQPRSKDEAALAASRQLVSHEEIVRQFLGSKAVDFNALGRFVATVGESIAITGRGDYGVRIGYYNILACFNIGPRVVSPIDVAQSGIASEVRGG